MLCESVFTIAKHVSVYYIYNDMIENLCAVVYPMNIDIVCSIILWVFSATNFIEGYSQAGILNVITSMNVMISQADNLLGVVFNLVL